MVDSAFADVLLGLATGALLAWLAAVAALVLVSRRTSGDIEVREAVRMLPALVRLLGGIARDHELPGRARLRVALLAGYLASPIDLVPDFIPLIGYADDALLVALTLRAIVRTAGPEVLVRHWHGSDDGLGIVLRLAGLPPAEV